MKTPKKPKNWRLIALITILVTLSGVLLFQRLQPDPIPEKPFSEVLTLIENKELKEADLNQGSYVLTGKLQDGTEFTTIYPARYQETLVEKLETTGVELSVDPLVKEPLWKSMLISLLPVVLIIIFLLFFLSGNNPFNKSKLVEQRPETRFKDVAGVDEALEELQEIVDYLKDPEPYRRVTAKPPTGVLLVGPPGTGKTLLARAMAGEADAAFFQTSGSSFGDMYVGGGAKKIRKLFKEARREPKAIIFIDEIDAVGRKRGVRNPDAASREMDNILTSLLTEIDGFDKHEIIVIGATNVPEVLDPALKRRLGKIVEVPLPDSKGREKILRLHSAGRPFQEGIPWDRVARQTTGFSGAQLEQVVDGAALEAARQKRDTIGLQDLMAAAMSLNLGKERKSAALTEFDKRVTAAHEAGHTVVAAAIPEAMTPTYVSIIPRGQSGGHTRFDPPEDNYFSKAMLLAQLSVAMGGRAGEVLEFGEAGVTQGASGDLEAATATATAFVTTYGMGKNLMKLEEDSLKLGADLSLGVAQEVEALLQEALRKATEVLELHRDSWSALREELLEKEALGGEELQKLLPKAVDHGD